MDEDVAEIPDAPPEKSGVPSTLERLHGASFPTWAERFFDGVRDEDALARLLRKDLYS